MESEAQMGDQALAYIVISIDQKLKADCKEDEMSWRSLENVEKTIQDINEAAIDAKLSTLQNVQLENGERIIEY